MSRLNTNQIFTHFIFKNINNENNVISHYGSVVFVLDKKIMKDLPFYAIAGQGCYNDTFEQGMKQIDVIIKSNGKMKIMPKIKRLKHTINKMCKTRGCGMVSFIYSHEIMFGKDISLRKYCKYIITIHKNKNKFKTSIPIIYTNNNVGINNLIHIINKFE